MSVPGETSEDEIPQDKVHQEKGQEAGGSGVSAGSKEVAVEVAVEASVAAADRHVPVLLNEVLELLAPSEGGLIIDCTLGMGGHSEAILRATSTGRVIGLDRDAEAIELAGGRLGSFGERFQAIHSDYRFLKQALGEEASEAAEFSGNSADGILADFGVSSFQLDSPERGFSFRFDADSPLDMRMDRSEGETAAELLNTLSETELADLIFEYGEERGARRIARRIAATRQNSPLQTTKQLADLVVGALNQKGHWKIHPATRTFQALRIAVNRELEGLDGFISDAVDVLRPGGTLVIITFHSLEDRIVKQSLKFQSGYCKCPPQLPDCRCGAVRRVELLTSKPVTPHESEIEANPRARSAKLRACRKL